MIKVASCGEISHEGGEIASWLQRCASEAGVECALDEYENPVNLLDACAKALTEVPYDLVICAVDLVGISGVHVASELNDLHSMSDELKIVLCSESAEHAYDAQTLGVDGYLVEPVKSEDFDRVVGRCVREIAQLHRESAVIRCRDRVRRISYTRLSYAETFGHDQRLHYLGQPDTYETRSSSGDLFDILEGDGRFFKVGNSHIVNLDHVVQLDSKNGVALLADGSQIPIPVRNRKPFENALHERGSVLA